MRKSLPILGVLASLIPASSAFAVGVPVPFPRDAMACILDPLVLKILGCGVGGSITPAEVTAALHKTQVLVLERPDWSKLAAALWGNDGARKPAVTVTGSTRASLSSIGVHKLACYNKRHGDSSDGPTLLRNAEAELRKIDPGMFLPGASALPAIYVNGSSVAADLATKYITHEGVHAVLDAHSEGKMIPGDAHIILGVLGWNGPGTAPCCSTYVGTSNSPMVPPTAQEQARHAVGLPTSIEVTQACSGLGEGASGGSAVDGVAEDVDCGIVAVNGASSGTSSDATKSATDVPVIGVEKQNGVAEKGMEFSEQNAKPTAKDVVSDIKDAVETDDDQ